ncbi:MAG: hypothetical protein R3236_04485, partial [Phycisphaeraceae bacterium]|nr:hypothetical protein [Phycisphaeraceae bacterium]
AYAETKSLDFKTPEQTLSLPVLEHASKFRRSGGRNPRRIDDETLRIALSPEQLKTLMALKNPTGQIGPNRFVLGPELRTALAIFQRRLRQVGTQP